MSAEAPAAISDTALRDLIRAELNAAVAPLRDELRAAVDRLRELAPRAHEVSEPKRRAAHSSLGLSISDAARVFKRSKSTIAARIAEGRIATVPGSGRRTPRVIPHVEVARLEREGFPAPERAATTPKRKRERKIGAATARVEREAAAQRALAVKD